MDKNCAEVTLTLDQSKADYLLEATTTERIADGNSRSDNCLERRHFVSEVELDVPVLDNSGNLIWKKTPVPVVPRSGLKLDHSASLGLCVSFAYADMSKCLKDALPRCLKTLARKCQRLHT